MKKAIIVVLVILSCLSLFANSGDTITVIVDIPEVKPEFAVTNEYYYTESTDYSQLVPFSSYQLITIRQTNTARYIGNILVTAYVMIDTPKAFRCAKQNEYYINGMRLGDAVTSYNRNDYALHFDLYYDGTNYYPHSVAQFGIYLSEESVENGYTGYVMLYWEQI